MRKLESFYTRKLDVNGNPFYIIIDHDNHTISPTMQYGSMDRYTPRDHTALSTKREVKAKHAQFIARGYTETNEFN